MLEDLQKQNTLNLKFQDAVENNDIEAVKTLFSPLEELLDRADDLSEDEYQKAFLEIQEEMPYIDYIMVTTQGIMRAAQKENWELVKVLYNLNASIDDVKILPHHWYLIHECIDRAPLNITKAIIDGANVNVKTAQGETPFMLAIKREKSEITEYLLESGRVQLNEVDKKGNSAAHYAVLTENYDLFLKIIEKGAWFLNKNKEGKTPVDLIEDQSFRLSFDEHLEKIEAAGNKISLANAEENSVSEILTKDIVDEVKTIEPQKPKVSGLSKIQRK